MTEKVALVTGASSGIGEAFARELARRGFSLILVARREDRLRSLSAEFGAAGISVDLRVADLATGLGVGDICRRLELGGISVCVNNAGVGHRGPLLDQDPESVRQIARLNFEAPMLLSQAALKPMVRAGAGALINVVSMGAFQPVPFLNTYAASKAGLLSFTEALAEEVSTAGVRVQALCPGNIPTGFQETAGTRGSRFDRTPAMSASEVARSSLDEVFGRGRTLHLPGLQDRLAVFGQRFLPRSVPRRIAARLLRPE